MTITPNESSFLGLGFELILYGIYIVLFIMASLSLTVWRKTLRVQKFYLFFCFFLFSCCTIHVFIKFRYMFKDIEHPNPNGTLEAGTPALRVADALVTLTDFFGELVWIYRVWAIWNRNYYIIILPVIVSLAFVSCAMATIGILVSTPAAAIVPPSLVPLGTSAFAVPLAFNFIVTTLIIGRIWYLGRQRHNAHLNSGQTVFPRSYIWEAMIVIVESGGLYLLVQFVLMVLFAMNHPAQILVSDIATQVYGIAPTLIFVRVGLGNAVESADNTGNAPRTPNGMRFRTAAGGNFSALDSKPGDMNATILSVPVTKTVMTHRDEEWSGGTLELKDLSASDL
ncbi:hypothetical protein JB92DRAFT_1911315 [Gautieria morchelliformis]|nr:hypothetical protein JB92DRAFT_1911315 [Gautieria morchelliformis]